MLTIYKAQSVDRRNMYDYTLNFLLLNDTNRKNQEEIILNCHFVAMNTTICYKMCKEIEVIRVPRSSMDQPSMQLCTWQE